MYCIGKHLAMEVNMNVYNLLRRLEVTNKQFQKGNVKEIIQSLEHDLRILE